MTERQFTRNVLTFARERGWLAAHFGNTVKVVKRKDGYATIPDKDALGFPDCVFLRKGRLVFAELKVGSNKPTPAQQEWLERLADVFEVDSYLWRPTDWTQIEEVLA